MVSTVSLGEIPRTAYSILRDVATSKLASDLSSGSKKPEPVSSVSTSEIYSWASQLASESRKLDWVLYWYVFPDAVREIIHKLETMNGGIFGLVGLQGVGKSSALLAIESGRMIHQLEEYRRAHKSGEPPDLGRYVIHFGGDQPGSSPIVIDFSNNT
ncbi:hypothetical protein MUP07_01410 [Candidatus Bathyarchaeota archaeon]|nr:hypothetical protein [Candidatus Bathyarchaeota archaeon]